MVSTNRPLRMYVIYCNPSDYPGKYVGRISNIFPGRVVPEKECVVSETLSDIRHDSYVKGFGIKLLPSRYDDPVICEMYV